MRQVLVDRHDTRAYPLGLTVVEGGIHISVAAAADCCSLLLFSSPDRPEADVRIPFPEEGRMGDVWEMTVLGDDLDQYWYAFEADGKAFADPCGRRFLGWEQWGQRENRRDLLIAPVRQEDFDWEGDRPLQIPYEDRIVYRAHVRGFTRHSKSKVKDKGTFRGVIEKIPYLKELGITTLELLPVAEFAELAVPEKTPGNPYGLPERVSGNPHSLPEQVSGNPYSPSERINYWGYAPAMLFAPKAAYAGPGRDPVRELKNLVKELHKAGIELVTELHFTGGEPPELAAAAVRHWVREYHLDGIHLTGNAPLWLLARDPYLRGTPLWATSWEPGSAGKGPRYLAEYNDGFLTDMRRALRGDEGQMNTLAFRARQNPPDVAVINYIAGTNGFTLWDMVSYEQKHNEDNGEQNRDGSIYNYTWNCGAEGPSRKRKVTQTRRRQLRNALLLLFLSQGTPMLLAGDEFGQTQNGNNNAYCQDNPLTWLDWSRVKKNGELLDFVRFLIAFRKAHPVFHRAQEPRLMDTMACGLPDVSYHGSRAWVPDLDVFSRQLGIFYCGEYGKKPDGSADDFFYVAYNMHDEAHDFALPHLPGNRGWYVAIDTGSLEDRGYCEPGEERPLDTKKQVNVPGRTVLVLMGKKEEEKKQEKAVKTAKNLDKQP